MVKKKKSHRKFEVSMRVDVRELNEEEREEREREGRKERDGDRQKCL